VDFRKLHILVADDLDGTRRLLRSVLISLGVGTVDLAVNGDDAWEQLQHVPPDILLADWEMQPLDGIALTRRIRDRTKSPNPYLPVIMVTAHSELDRVRRARDAGVTEFLAKPITTNSIVSRLVKVILRPRQFVLAADFFGPDRRRRNDPNYKGPRRRKVDIDGPVAPEDMVEM